MVNHFYFYCVDADFGPFFLKFCSYFPYNAKLGINSEVTPAIRRAVYFSSCAPSPPVYSDLFRYIIPL